MNKFCGRDAHRAGNSGGVAQGLRGHPILAVCTVQITTEHAETVSQCPWMSMEEGFFLYRVALDTANIAPGHKQRSAAVVANLANPGLAFWDLATVPAGKTPHPVAVELFVEFALANVFMNDFAQCTHMCQGQCQRNVSYLLFDTCRAEIYRRHRTDLNTGPAVNALSGIDIELKHFIERRASIVISAALCRMDTIHRAHIY